MHRFALTAQVRQGLAQEVQPAASGVAKNPCPHGLGDAVAVPLAEGEAEGLPVLVVLRLGAGVGDGIRLTLALLLGDADAVKGLSTL